MFFQAHDTFDFAGDEFAALHTASGATVFQSGPWLAAFYATVAAARGAKPRIVSIRDKDRLVGVLPMIVRRKAGLALLEATDLGVSDYASPVVLPEAVARIGNDAVLQGDLLAALMPFDVVRVRPIPEPFAESWHALLGGTLHDLTFSAHATPLSGSHAEWRSARLDRKVASQMARKGKRWKKQHDVALTRLHGKDAAQAIMELATLRAGRFEGDPIQDAEVAAFYSKVATIHPDAETWRLSSDGETAAIVFGMTQDGAFHYLLIGADYDNHGRHSPGLQAYDWLIEDWMARGGTSFDFTIGDEPFKAQFGAEATPMNALLGAASLKGKLAVGFAAKRLLGEGAA